MPVIEASPVEIECILSASDTYIETLTVKLIEAQPWSPQAHPVSPRIAKF